MKAKLASKNPAVTGEEVREAFVLTRLERDYWEYDPDRGGWRLLVTGTTYNGRRLNGVLYPTALDGTWWLGTAMWAQ